MASSADHDSHLTLRFVALDGSGEETKPLELAPQIPIIDVGSSADDPLPPLDEEAPASFPELQVSYVRNASPGPRSEPPGGIWLRGDVLMCACPDCGAPMTIRQWLMVADCWSCGISIELTEEQEREVRRLLQKQEDAPARPGQAESSPSSADPVKQSEPSQQEREERRRRQPQSAPQRPAGQREGQSARPAREVERQTSQRDGGPAPPPPPDVARHRPPPMPRTRARIRHIARRGGARVWLRDQIKQTPAWLVSLVFHLILLTLLGLLTFEKKDPGRFITLSSAVSRNVREGGENVITPQDDIAFDLPIPQDVDLEDPQQREAMIRADQDARELQLDPNVAEPNLPELSVVKAQMNKPGQFSAALVARDPRLRVEMVRKEGGTTLTEAAVARGLRWLSKQQSADGRWRLDGGLRSDSAATSLALMPFLGAGQTHLAGRYRDTVSRGLRWLVEHQKADGDLRADSRGNAGMYAHGQGAIVLCEAFLMTGDEELRVPAQKSIDFIVAAQYLDGGWRYEPHDPKRRNELGDTSVVGWQLMALQSARAANLSIDPRTFERAHHFLDTVQSEDGSRYAYQRGRTATHVMTAEGLLCRVYLGWNKQSPGLGEGVEYLINRHPPTRSDHNIYYWYYATQTLHHYGGQPWQEWNQRMRDVLVESQVKRGSLAGSWNPGSPHSGGRLYETALAVCSLEVYYRHLPIFRQIDVE